MGGTSVWVSVTCGCGRDVRFRRDLMRQGVRCPACGGPVAAPVEPAAGPSCPHCGHPWPVDEKRCPSCLARSRQIGPLPEEAYAPEIAPTLPPRRKRFGRSADEPAEPVDIDALHWHQRPNRLGWLIAAGATALVGLTAFVIAMVSPCAWAWVLAGLILLALGLGVCYGSGTARGLMVLMPLLVLVGQGTLLLAYASPLASAGGLIAQVIILVMTAVGLAVLTRSHGRNDTVVAGAAMTGVGLLALCLNPALLSADHPAWSAVAASLAPQAARAAPRDNAPPPQAPAASEQAQELTTAPQPAAPAGSVADRRPIQPMRTPSPPASAPAVVEPPAERPESDTAAIATWRDAMAAHAFRIEFNDPTAVRAERRAQEIDGRTIAIATYLLEGPAAYCAAIVYEDVADPASGASHDDLLAMAHHAARHMDMPTEYEMWRTDMNPLVYFIRLKDEDGQRVARVESRQLGRGVLVLIARHRQDDNVGKHIAYQFFHSFALSGPAR